MGGTCTVKCTVVFVCSDRGVDFPGRDQTSGCAPLFTTSSDQTFEYSANARTFWPSHLLTSLFKTALSIPILCKPKSDVNTLGVFG